MTWRATPVRLLAAVLLLAGVACRDGSPPSGDPPAAARNDVAGALRDDAGRRASAAEASGTMAVAGRDGWLFLGSELRHVAAGEFWGPAASAASRATRPEHADPLPAILDFKEQLDRLGIELLVVPVPPKSIIYPDALLEELTVPPGQSPPRLDLAHQAFYGILAKHGVQVLDLAPAFLGHRYDDGMPLYCRQDSHWAGSGIVLASRAISAHLSGRPWLGGRARLPLEQEWRTLEIEGDLSRGIENRSRERVRVRFVGRRTDTGLVPVDPDPESPVLLLGDSHNLVFHAGGDMHGRGAGLADQLALELGFPVDLVAVRGSGATPARINVLRRAQRDPDYWSTKRLVVWVFAARELTESDGWRKVPVTP